MATNKHAMIRYQALDKCFRNKYRRFYMEDLIEACNTAIYELTGTDPDIQRRQIFNDINYMESPEGWEAPIERYKDGRKVYYSYYKDFSINERPLSDKEMDMLTQAVVVLSRFKGMPQFEWMESLLANLQDKFYLRGNSDYIIGFEQNVDYVAANYLTDLFMAIVNKQVLHIKYRTFEGVDINWVLHPYYIKEYNNRWFLFGLNNDIEGQITNVALDRIVSFETVQDVLYIENKEIDFDEYFDDVVGVTIPAANSVEHIIFQFTPKRFPYIKSKPLHGSMKIIDEEKCIVEISVIPNKELISMIMSFGNDVEILSPKWFREAIKEKIDDLAKKYSTCAQ